MVVTHRDCDCGCSSEELIEPVTHPYVELDIDRQSLTSA